MKTKFMVKIKEAFLQSARLGYYHGYLAGLNAADFVKRNWFLILGCLAILIQVVLLLKRMKIV